MPKKCINKNKNFLLKKLFILSHFLVLLYSLYILYSHFQNDEDFSYTLIIHNSFSHMLSITLKKPFTLLKEMSFAQVILKMYNLSRINYFKLKETIYVY